MAVLSLPLLNHKRLSLRHLALTGLAFTLFYIIYNSFLPPFYPGFHQPPPHRRPPVSWKSNTRPEEWARRAQAVKGAFIHAYRGYEKFAFGRDEVMPLTNVPIDNFNGWGVTMVDSLDTMLLMGLTEEFERALPLVEQTTFHLNDTLHAPFFETVIRYLGGLLSAHALSSEPILLARADDLGRLLSPAFNTSSGFPAYAVNTVSGQTRGPLTAILAEIASCQLEYLYLAKATGKKEHFDKANHINHLLESAALGTQYGGMLPVRWNLTSGTPWDGSAQLSVGAAADSAHEYLLKQYLLSGKTDKASLEMYLRTTTRIITSLLYLSPTRHLLYVTDASVSPTTTSPSHVFEHLSCFLPGLFTLGASLLPLDNLEELGVNWDDIIDGAGAGSGRGASGKGEYGLTREERARWRKVGRYNLKELHMWVAEGLGESCYLMYADQKSGLGPDEVVFNSNYKTSTGSTHTGGNRVDGSRQGSKGRPGIGWGVGDGDGIGEVDDGKWFDVVERWRRSGGRGPPPGVGVKKRVVYDDTEKSMGPYPGHARDYLIRKTEYLLRPETIESIYLLWRTTGDDRWRERGWLIFEAIERESKTPTAYATIKTVHTDPPRQDNSMPSYFLAETLKYLYLLFMDQDLIPLDKWVFNTEAHPFPVFNWTLTEKNLFGIP
ncbi:glycoside hydrolase family 47 protein [Jaapia argillacea MUCL 33604]|uniref:alpha-1,2-Mannosidase n=1 Tax=Jaapia argillacea MUCL 33604 TaxID=933084 RepID=A0A067P812_9AGAM|nr:glycoside hydrolase family 47 protein [Jaapia argillacea MUCL 33604]